MTHPFPYPVGARTRRLTAKPVDYKGWTIYAYQTWCQQTHAPKGEWRDLALATNGNEKIIGGDIRQAIDWRISRSQSPAGVETRQ